MPESITFNDRTWVPEADLREAEARISRLEATVIAVVRWSNERDTCVYCETWDDHYEGCLIADLDDAASPTPSRRMGKGGRCMFDPRNGIPCAGERCPVHAPTSPDCERCGRAITDEDYEHGAGLCSRSTSPPAEPTR